MYRSLTVILNTITGKADLAFSALDSHHCFTLGGQLCASFYVNVSTSISWTVIVPCDSNARNRRMAGFG